MAIFQIPWYCDNVILQYIIPYLLWSTVSQWFGVFHSPSLSLEFALFNEILSFIFLLCTIFIQFFRPLILCLLTSFWLSYSISQSNYQSSRFSYPFVLSLSPSLFSRSIFSWYVTLPSSLPFYINICIRKILYLTIFLAPLYHCVFLIFSLSVSLLF